jgi:hypothetical protein
MDADISVRSEMAAVAYAHQASPDAARIVTNVWYWRPVPATLLKIPWNVEFQAAIWAGKVLASPCTRK